MEKHEQQRKQNIILGEQRAKVDWDDELTFQPPKAKKMPDFERAQKHFQALLDKKRSHKKPTQPVPFNFEQNKKIPQIHYLETDNENIKRDKEIQLLREKNEHNLAKMRATASDSFIPDATKAYIAQVEKTKKERLERAAKEDKKRKEQQEREKKYEEAAVKLRQTLAATEAEKQRKKEEELEKAGGPGPTKKEEFALKTKEYQKKLKDMNKQLEERPPVFQTGTCYSLSGPQQSEARASRKNEDAAGHGADLQEEPCQHRRHPRQRTAQPPARRSAAAEDAEDLATFDSKVYSVYSVKIRPCPWRGSLRPGLGPRPK